MRVIRMVDAAFTIPETSGERMAGRAALFHLVHLRDLFDSVVLLLPQARAHGAFVLGRSMFETSLMLGAMEDPQNRDAVVLRWFQDSSNAFRRLVKSWEEVGVETDIDDADTVLGENDEKLAAARRELGIAKLPPSLHIETEARRQGRVEDIPSYLTAHAFTHGAYSALKLRVVHHDSGARSTFHLTQAHNVEAVEAAANFAGRSALLGCRSGYRILGVPEPESIPGLLALIEFDDIADGVKGVE